MIRDLLTVMWKEWKEYLQQDRTRRGTPLRLLLLVLGGGAFFAWQVGPAFGRSWITVFFISFLSVMFVAAVVPDSFAGERERHTLDTLLASRLSDEAILFGKVAASITYGWTIGLTLLTVGMLAVLAAYGPGEPPFPRPEVVLTALVASLLVGALIAGLGVLISLWASSVQQAHQLLGFTMLGLFFVPLGVLQLLPHTWMERLVVALRAAGPFRALLLAAASVVVLDLLLLAFVRTRFRRGRLIS